MRNYHGNLNACETQLSGSSTMGNGLLNLTLTAPKVGTDGKPNTGSVDLEVNLSAATASSSDRTCISSTESTATNANSPWFSDATGPDPTGRASFGIYKAPIIYMRENF
jgi:MSHA biogenesis protein MshQ